MKSIFHKLNKVEQYSLMMLKKSNKNPISQNYRSKNSNYLTNSDENNSNITENHSQITTNVNKDSLNSIIEKEIRKVLDGKTGENGTTNNKFEEPQLRTQFHIKQNIDIKVYNINIKIYNEKTDKESSRERNINEYERNRLDEKALLLKILESTHEKVTYFSDIIPNSIKGWYNPSTDTIHISRFEANSAKKYVLTHEQQHRINHYLGLPQDENIIDQVTRYRIGYSYPDRFTNRTSGSHYSKSYNSK